MVLIWVWNVVLICGQYHLLEPFFVHTRCGSYMKKKFIGGTRSKEGGGDWPKKGQMTSIVLCAPCPPSSMGNTESWYLKICYNSTNLILIRKKNSKRFWLKNILGLKKFVGLKQFWVWRKGAVALYHLWLRNFCTSSYSMRIIHRRSKKFQPLVYMWSKPAPSFSNVCALLLKIWTCY